MKKNKLLVFYFLLTIPILANDFYPLNITPANGAIYSQSSSIPILFDVCLGFDYPAAANEWYVEIKIFDSNEELVYLEIINGFEANGPACYPISDAPEFFPYEDGTFSLQIQIFYAQEINSENDLLVSEFVVKTVKDLAIVSFISPQPMEEIFIGLGVEFKFIVRNNGDLTVKKNDYLIELYTESTNIDPELDEYYIDTPIEYFDIEPYTEKEFTVIVNMGQNILAEDLNKILEYSVQVLITDDNVENNVLIGGDIIFLPNPLWPNEFRFGDGLFKSGNNLENNDFVEFIVTDNFREPELYSLFVYDSSGHQVDSTSLNLFTVGETVDSFTVYSYEFNGDVLPNHGAIALTYDSLRFTEYFISWGGSITAVEGIWKDSISTDIGITPTAGNSISLSGHGTDFSSFTWESSIPTPGLFNDSQLVPVEEQLTVPNQYKLEQNYPNPFNPTTTINYTIPVVEAKFASTTNVLIKLFDVLGREVRTLVNEVQSAGNYEVSLDATELTSGVYYYQLTAGDYMETRKMSLLK